MEFIELDSKTAINEAIKASESTIKLIVCGSRDQRGYIEEALNFSDLSPEEIINTSDTIDIHKWFQEKQLKLERFANELGLDNFENIGEWSDEIETETSFTFATDLVTRKPIADLIGLKMEVDSSWKIPAHLKYGGWNDCPHSEIHCAVWKYWEKKYGARIIGANSDTIEAYVTNPPKSKEEAMQLAWEQYLYCSDIVDQGVETISNLGVTLLNNKCWFFWWD